MYYYTHKWWFFIFWNYKSSHDDSSLSGKIGIARMCRIWKYGMSWQKHLWVSFRSNKLKIRLAFDIRWTLHRTRPICEISNLYLLYLIRNNITIRCVIKICAESYDLLILFPVSTHDVYDVFHKILYILKTVIIRQR